MTTVQMNDDLLRQYVDGIFERYDLDRSNTLTADELVVFFNDLLGSRGNSQKMTLQQVQQSLRAMDANNDGQITKT
jgi:Ca2+-binding EF-hand superfamily protein